MKIIFGISTLRFTVPLVLLTKVGYSLQKFAGHLIDSNFTTGGIFKLELFLPDDYPMNPPKIRFLTKIFHPNVDKLGRICLDVLKSKTTRATRYYRPQYMLHSVHLADLAQISALKIIGHLPFRFEPYSSVFRPSLVPRTLMIHLRPMLRNSGRKIKRLQLPLRKSGQQNMLS